MNNPYNYTGPHFDGSTYVPSFDHTRLTGQLRRVLIAMSDGCWCSLHDLAQRSSVSELSIGSRVRDLRKVKFGSHIVDQKRVSGGLYLYRLEIEPQQEMSV